MTLSEILYTAGVLALCAAGALLLKAVYFALL